MAYTRYYESSTSGLNFDRFVDRFDEPTLSKMRQQYWTAKQLIRKKLGKKEDEYLLASDAEFDTKVTLFRFVQQTSDQMLCCIDDYQHYLSNLAQVEFELSKMLKEDGGTEIAATGHVMITVARVLSLSVYHRLQIRNPLLRLFGELHVFTERAILDCADTVDAAEKARTEYRGSLLWMKKTSKELDPDAGNILEKFRTAQNVVRKNKEKLDCLKLDTLQKVDLLIASRYNLFSQLLESYQKLLYNFYEQTTLAYEKIYDCVSSRKQYKFEVLTDLNESHEDLSCENDEQIEAIEKEPQNLIEIEQYEAEMVQMLQNLENSNGQDLFVNRIESPLVALEECQNELANDGPSEIVKSLEVNSVDQISKDTIPPAIPPPPGWKPTRNVNRHPSSDLIDLQFLNDATSEVNTFTSDWSKFMANITATTTSTTSLPPSQSSSSLSSSSNLLTLLPSQLLEYSSTAQTDFPNPFIESTDANSNIWKEFLKDIEGIENNGDRIFKNCC